MSVSLLVNIGWFGHVLTCFYIIRPLRNILIRTILTLIPCILLTDIGARNLPSHQILSLFIIATYWMISIRLIHLTVIEPKEFNTLVSFMRKSFWILFPVIPCQSRERQWSILYYIISAIIKFVINRWLHKWLLICQSNDNYMRVIIYFISILSYSYFVDIQTVIVIIITQNKYTFQWLNNFPFLSQSLREFWGRRYNQIVGTIFKESIYRPLNKYISSRSFVSLITFIVSGLFHAHIVLLVFNDPSSMFSTFSCFFLNGLACCIEAHLPIKFPPLIGWLVTHTVLFFTAPLCLGPFARDKSVFFEVEALSSFGDQWISKLPVPKTCP